MSAFTDSIDSSASGTYPAGICGEKRLTLDSSSPAFVQVKLPSANAATSPASLAFDHTKAVGADIKTHVVNYTVKMVEYDGIVAEISGSLKVVI